MNSSSVSAPVADLLRAPIVVLGASGAIGRFLLPRLVALNRSLIAVSRREPPPWARPLTTIDWRIGDLFVAADVPDAATVISLGPLDGLIAWIQREPPTALRRVIAFSSTSASSKRDSADPAERELSARLRRSEAALAQWCEAHGAALTVLRPTLIYGAGVDRNLSRIAALGRRWRCFALPRSATGLRQPVHADDLAAAACATLSASATCGRTYDLPGGETLTHREMVRRVLACLPRRSQLLLLPEFAFRALLRCARVVPAFRDLSTGVIDRLARDLVYDASAAALDFGYAPRDFVPTLEMFATPRDSAVAPPT